MTSNHFMGKHPIHPSKVATALPIPATNLNISSVVLSQISVDLAIELGFGSLFNNSTNVNYTAFLVDVVATMPEIQMPTNGTVFDGNVYGTGLRACLSAVNFDTKNTLSLSGITFEMQSKAITASCDVQIFGLPQAVSVEIASYLNLASIDSHFMVKFGRAIQLVMDALSTPSASLDAYPLYNLPASTNELVVQTLAASQGYALHRINKGDSFDEAMTRLSKAPKLNKGYPYNLVDEFVTKGVYFNILATTDDNAKPSGYDKSVANDIANLKK